MRRDRYKVPDVSDIANFDGVSACFEPEVFTKHDGGKDPMFELCTYNPAVLSNEARCLKHGADKYGRHNWQRADNIEGRERYLAAMFRHMLALMHGEVTDPDSGLPHTAHIRCCAGFVEYFVVGPTVDYNHSSPSPSPVATDSESFRRMLDETPW